MRTVLDEASWLAFVSDLVNDVKGAMDSKDFKNVIVPSGKTANYIGGSISKYTKDLIMTFPTLIDNSLSPETASMISKANERNIISMLQILFASMQIRATDGKEVIERIYGNKYGLGKMSYDDYADALMGLYDKYTESVSEDVMADAVKKMEAELKRPMKDFPTDSFSDTSLNDFQAININGTQAIKFSPVKNVDESVDELESFTEAPTPPQAGPTSFGVGWAKDDYGFFHRDPYMISAPDVDTLKTHNQALNYYYNKQNQDAINKLNKKNYKLDKEKFAHQKMQDAIRNRNDIERNIMMQSIQKRDAIEKQLLDSDIKKANEMQPSLLIIHYSEVDPEISEIIDTRSFVAGVKSRLIPVSSSDIVDRIVVKNKTSLNFLNFVRATTGEISFMKDFILCIKQAKIDAKNSIKRGEAAEMWKTLESLAVKNRANKIRKSGNDASAITTLVINKETVNLIMKQYEINLESVPVARKILDEYNLLGIMIADESIETVKFLYDGQDMFEEQAYSFLEKENSDSKAYKKIINLMGQNRRF